MNTLTEIRGRLAAKELELKQLFDSHKDETGQLKMDAESIEKAEALNRELIDLVAQQKSLAELEGAAAKMAANVAPPTAPIQPEQKAEQKAASAAPFWDRFAEKVLELDAKGGGTAKVDAQVKTVMSTGAGFAPFIPRDDVVMPSPTRQLTLLDVLPVMPWSQSAYRYMLETTYTNNAVEELESVQGALQTFGEAAIAFTETTVNMRKVATYLPVSDEQIKYGGATLGAYLEQRLKYMVQARMESQLLVGDGNAPNILGIANSTNAQTQAMGADDQATALFKAMTLIATNGFANATDVVLHPADYEALCLLQATTGQYLFSTGLQNAPTTFWGRQVIVTTAATQNTGVVFDRNFLTAVIDPQVELEYTKAHSTWFISGVQAVRAIVYAAMVCYRGTAVCTVTGI